MNAGPGKPAALCAALVLGVSLAVPAHAGDARGADTHEIVIGTGTIVPPLLRTTTERTVTFVNRTGRLVHLEFIGKPGEHRLFQVPGRISAVFHGPGRHPYVVHVGPDATAALHGAIEVENDPMPAGARTCTGLTIMEVCFEP